MGFSFFESESFFLTNCLEMSRSWKLSVCLGISRVNFKSKFCSDALLLLSPVNTHVKLGDSQGHTLPSGLSPAETTELISVEGSD